MGLTPEELTRHLVIVGQTGSGKSNLLHHLLVQLMDAQIPWCVTDFKRSTRHLAALPTGQDIQVLALGRDIGAPFSFNPLAPPPGVGFDVHIRQIAEEVNRAYTGGDGVANLIIAAATRLWCNNPKRAPTLLDVQRAITSAKLKGRAATWAETAKRILGHLTSGPLGIVLNRRRDANAVAQLLDHHTVLELDGLSRQDAGFITNLIARSLHYTLLAQPQRERLRFVLALEEAQELVPNRTGARESIIETMARQSREVGLGMILCSQSPSTLSQVVMANCYGFVSMSLRSRTDLLAAAQNLLLDQEGAAMLSALPIGQGICRLSGRWPRAVHFQAPLISVPKGQMTDRLVEQRFRQGPFSRAAETSDSTQVNSAQASGPGGIATSEHIDGQIQLESAYTVESPDSGGRGIFDDPQVLALLRDIAAYPFDGVAKRYDRLGLARRKGNSFKNVLVEDGLIKPYPIKVPEGGIVLLEMTNSGRVFCAGRKFHITPINGSLQHAYWQDRVANRLRDSGWTVSTEWIHNDFRYDLHAELDSRTLVLEVETGSANFMHCIQRLNSLTSIEKYALLPNGIPQPVLRRCRQAGIRVFTPPGFLRWISACPNVPV
ncbi:MAG: DUF87 domain-containing protein [Phycisphaeraceae bacterium]|nr:DUF87 domain-containing protein [Phycisphaeraceae bacterium]